jgi:dTDP-4-dehydrorhamnose 3,5-epimerase
MGPPASRTDIAGVRLLELTPEDDARGRLVEISRRSWLGEASPVQWNAVTTTGGALRGVHWHNRHHDVIVAIAGWVLAGLVDLRRGSPTERKAELLRLDAESPGALVVPSGVGHGLLSVEPSVVMYGVSRYWDPDDELGVRWDDPELGIPWPEQPGRPLISGRDARSPSLADAGPLPTWEGTPAVVA